MKYLSPTPQLHDRDELLAPAHTLRDLLPALVLRLDHEAVEAVQRMVDEARSDQARDLETPHYLEDTSWSLWLALLDVCFARTRTIELLQEEWRTFLERHGMLLDEHKKLQVIQDHIRATTRGVVARYLDLRAARDTLDMDALQERQLLRETREQATLRVCLLAIEQLAARLLAAAEEHGEQARFARQIITSPAVTPLIAMMEDERSVERAWLAMRALQAPLSALFAHRRQPNPAWVRALARWLVSDVATSWIRITALEILSASPYNGMAILEEHLRTVKDHEPDNWHTRAHALRLLIERFPDHADTLLDLIFTHEPRDGVLIAGLRALDPETISDEHALEHLLTLCDREALTLPTRAAIAAVLGRYARAGAPRAAGLLVERMLCEDRDIDILQIAADELTSSLEALATTARDARFDALIEAMATQINQRIATEPDAAIANKLLDIRAALRALSLDTQALTLVERLRALRPGQRLDYTEPLEEHVLAQAMHQATRHDFGLYATARGGSTDENKARTWRIERGARQRFSPWRLMHEVRNPSPNKRQDLSHLTGHRYPGPLRAHSGSLAEVTPTTVPGERRLIREEGGWGGYLPLVDDLLDALGQSADASPVTLISEAGLTRLSPPPSRLARQRHRAYLLARYADFDLRRALAMKGTDAAERGRYLEDIEKELGIQITFEPYHQGDTFSPAFRGLFSETAQQKQLTAEATPNLLETTEEKQEKVSTTPLAALPLLGALPLADTGLTSLRDIATQLSDRLFARGQVRGQELILIMVAALLSFVGRMVYVRIQVDRWRRRIPLSIGGWGTRGKSGTERLKAGMFQGLGYDVFVKTTGCEAMCIHAPRQSTAREIFIYRPYDKATIWEQRDMLYLAQAMRSDVFLWECMALNPRYVDILQSVWMRDDLVTLTNAYPDHEDIQGPTGADVARTISRFIPKHKTVLTAEREMLPILKQRAAEQQSTLIHVGEAAELSLPLDVLQRFPYNEHPRNIALVQRMAVELGIDPEFAVFAMADYVVPDLGVLKVYPTTRILGRRLTFINGCSANERAGFMNNWLRMNLHELDPRKTPEKIVVTVVNNRADRIARSRVFADILVSDIAFDRHFLIGTNLSGLRTYMEEALDDLLNDLVILDPPTQQGGFSPQEISQASARLRHAIERFRLIDHSPRWLQQKLDLMARATLPEALTPQNDPPHDALTTTDASQHLLDILEPLERILHELASQNLESLEKLHATILAHPDFLAITTQVEALVTTTHGALEELPPHHPDRFALASAKAFSQHASEELVTAIAAHALHGALAALCHATTPPTPAKLEAFHDLVARTIRERYWRQVTSIDDSQTPGDAIIAQIAEHTPPGSDVQIMGTQNIKGTGLDFVYRWVDLHDTLRQLLAIPLSQREAFQDAMVNLANTDAPHLTEAINMRSYLLDIIQQNILGTREASLAQRAVEHLTELAMKRWQHATEHATQSDGAGQEEDAPWSRRLQLAIRQQLELLLDPFDAIWRRHHAERLQRLFIARRISHRRMATEMQKLNKRQKGGWL